MSGADAAEALIDHTLGVRWATLPEEPRRAALAFLHDTLAVGAAGARGTHADAVLAVARGWGAGAEAGVLGRPGVRLPAVSAAFVNAFQFHCQEYDCVHEAAVLHPMATLAAALLAEAGRGAPVSGEALLTAIVAGADVAVALGLAAAGPLSFFRPATAGVFGCVAGIASLRGLPRDIARDAFGHALAFAGGTMQAHAEGKPALPLQVANAARAALAAIDFARAGIAGVRRPIDGPFGYAALFEAAGAFDIARARLGDGHRIAELSWKPFPTGRAGHGGIVAAQRLMAEHGARADSLDSFEYRAPPLIARLVGRAAFAGMAPGHARLCLPYLVAVTLTRGTVGLGDFTPESLADPALLALAERVRVIDDGNADPAAFVPAMAAARLADGRAVTVAVTALPGAPADPLSEAQQREKARGCLAFAGLESRADALAGAVAALPDAPDALAAIRATGIIG